MQSYFNTDRCKNAPMVFVGSGSLIQENLVLEDACVVGEFLVTKSVKKKTWVIGTQLEF